MLLDYIGYWLFKIGNKIEEIGANISWRRELKEWRK
jgi:hypothetical protein